VRPRLTALNAATLVLFAVAVATAAYAVYYEVLERALDDELRASADDVQARQVTWDAARRTAVLGNLDRSPLVMPVLYVQAADGNGVVLARSATLGAATLPVDSARLTRALRVETWLEDVELDRQVVRIYGGPLWARSTSDTLVLAGLLQVARPTDPSAGQAVRALQFGALAAAALAVPLALVFAALMTRQALRPLDRVATALHTIGDAGDLTLRIDLDRERPFPAVRRLVAELNQMLGRLEVAARRVDEVLAAQRRFVADASHELRTPLTTLRGNIHLLREDPALTGDDEQRAILSDMAADTSRMSRLVNDLLLLAEADAGQHLELEDVNIRPLVFGLVRSVRWMREDVELRVDVAPGAPTWVRGDADRLTQVLLVLLDNALKFSPSSGRVDLSVSAAPRSGQAGLLIRVVDEGPGVEPTERDRIFERFYRADSARHGEGSGLGLAIARWIVHEHHGTLALEDDGRAQGASFTVWLPSTQPPGPE